MSICKTLTSERPTSLTLASTVAYCDATTDCYYERCCIGLMQGRAIPAPLREVGPLDPVCAGCGVFILGQAQKWWYQELLRREQLKS